jgi:Flp pilus assembly protein TadD
LAPRNGSTGRIAVLAAVLAVIALSATWPALTGAFVFDDELFLVGNRHLAAGLTWEGVRWAFTNFDVRQWVPLAWISSMIDIQLFGMDPRGHHLMSLLLHAVNSILVFFVLTRMTGAVGRSFFAAGLFAVHPLHVEPAAWIGGRADLQATFFWLLAVLAWQRYVHRPGPVRMAQVALPLALGLMTKANPITAPFVLLLIDVWPLGRWRAAGAPGGLAAVGRRLLGEKVSLFLLSAAAAGVTLVALSRGRIIVPMEDYPFLLRLADAPVHYLQYLARTLWPAGLAAFYPRVSLGAWERAGAAVLLAALTALAMAGSRRRGYLAAGWLWFLVTLLPVIGILRARDYPTADRYLYVPLLGLFIVASWGAADLSGRFRALRRVLPVAGALVLIVFIAASRRQAGYWLDSITLFDHAAAVTRDNALAEYNLGKGLQDAGRFDEAERHYREALRIKPAYPDARANLGLILAGRGRVAEAEAEYRRAIAVEPGCVEAWNNLGTLLRSRGRPAEALMALTMAVRYDPGGAIAWNNLGLARVDAGDPAGARGAFGKAIGLAPRFATARANLAMVLESEGRFAEADRLYRQALSLDPGLTTAIVGLESLRGRMSGAPR